MDISRVLERLCPSAMYRLDFSIPPHKIVEWKGPDEMPTASKMALCWSEIVKADSDKPVKLSLEERVFALEKEVFKL